MDLPMAPNDKNVSNAGSSIKNVTVAQLIAHVRMPLYRNAYALVLNGFSTSGLGLVYWFLAARYYSTEAVGFNSAVISSMMFLSGLSQLNLVGAMVRFIPVAGRSTTRLVTYAYASTLLLAAVVSLIFVLGLRLWSPDNSLLEGGPLFRFWFVCSSMFWCIFALQDGVLTGLRQTTWVPIENTLFGLAKILLLVALAAAMPEHGIFASWTIPMVLALVPVNLLIFRRLVPRHVRTSEDRAISITPHQIIQFVMGDYAGALFVEMSTSLLPVIVLSQAGANANAHFYLAWIIAYALRLVAMNMATSLTVEGAADQARLGLYSRSMLIHMARLILPMVTVVVLGAPFILRLFGESYAAEGTRLLRLLALAVIPTGINGLYLSIARVQRRMMGVVLVQGTLCALTLSLSTVLLKSLGITGIGLAWLLGQTAVATVLLLTQLRPLLGPVIQEEPEGFA